MAVFIPDETINQIQRAADIVEVVSKRVALKKTGKNFQGLCPFHAEKTPSFSVNPEKKIFYCFGCGAGGDIFSFLMKLEGMNFPEAARYLASLYGIEIYDQSLPPHSKRLISEKDKIYKVNLDAANFYRNALSDAKLGSRALRYLSERGMTPAIIEKFQLGYASSGWDNLTRFFARKKMPVDLLKKAGLIAERKEGNGYYDRFRDRIIFPIYDYGRRLIAFGGRVMDNSVPKYLNSPETPVYQKSKSLYGIHVARRSCRETSLVYVVEGYFDLIALHLFGIENVVATLGTALTADHVQILRGLVGDNGKAVLVFDSDTAGIKAASRSIGLFEKGFLNAQILILPTGYDPDTYIREYGRERFLQISKNALGVVPFLLESAVDKFGLSIEGKVQIVNDLVEPLSALSDGVARGLYIKTIGERLGIDEHAIYEKIRQFSKQQWKGPTNKGPTNNGTARLSLNSIKKETVDEKALESNHRVRIERKLVAMMLNYPNILPELKKRQIVHRMQDQALREVGQMILEVSPDDGTILNTLMGRIREDKIKPVVASLSMVDEIWDYDGCQRLINQFENSVKRGGDDISQQIKAAERNNDIEMLQKLLLEKQMRMRGSR